MWHYVTTSTTRDVGKMRGSNLVTQKHVFMLTNTVGTGMMVRLIPLLQAWSSDQVYVFGNSTGAQPQRSMPAAQFVFNHSRLV